MMEKISIEGGKPLFGKVEISGSKNSSLSILASCLLSDKQVSILGIPKLTDTFFFLELLSSFGVDIEGLNNFKNTKKFILNAKKITNNKAPYNLVKKMRASILVLGPLLARTGRAIVSLPGGCTIGLRPVDIHLKSLEKLGAKIFIEKGYIYAEALKGLKGNKIVFPKVSVGATINVLMAAVLAKGITEIHNAAKEHGLELHMDGARLMNASVATGVPASDYADTVNSVWIDLTKEGQALLASMPSDLQATFHTEFAKLASWEQAMMVATLERLVGMLNAGQIEAGPVLEFGDLSASERE